MMRMTDTHKLQKLFDQIAEYGDIGNHDTRRKFYYAVYDRMADEYSDPFCQHNRAYAIRSFRQVIKTRPDVVPLEDIRLDLVGAMVEGIFIPIEPIIIAAGIEFAEEGQHDSDSNS